MDNVFLKSGKALVEDQFADYIPPDGTASVADILGSIADRWTLDYWDIGYVTNLLLGLVKENGLPVADWHVFEAVAGWLHNEVAWQTVRYYSKVTEFYWQKDIDKYGALPFAHFALAMQYPEWEKVLDLAVVYMDNHAGRYPSRNWLIEAMSGRLYERQLEAMRDALPTQDEAQIASVADGIDYDVMEAGETGAVRPIILKSFETATMKVLEVIDRVQLLEHHKVRLRSLLVELVELIGEIVN